MIPDKILNVFISSIKMVCDSIACYCNDPVSDFTRKRKLPVETLIHFIIQMQSKNLNSELYEYLNDIDRKLFPRICKKRFLKPGKIPVEEWNTSCFSCRENGLQ